MISRPSALPWLRERSGISSAGGSPDDGPTVGSGRIPRYDSHSAPGVRHTNGRLSDLAGVSVVSSAGPPVSAGACGSSPASGAGAPTVRAGGCDGVGSRAAPVHGAPSGAGPPSSSTWFRRPAEHASRSSSRKSLLFERRRALIDPAWTGTPAEAPLRSRSQPGRARTGTDAGVLKPADGAREVEVVLGGCVPRSRSICSSRRGLDDAERAADATRIEARGHDPHVCVHDRSLGVCCDSQPASPSQLSVRTLLGGRPTHRRAVTSVGCWLWSLWVSRTGRAGSRRQAAG